MTCFDVAKVVSDFVGCVRRDRPDLLGLKQNSKECARTNTQVHLYSEFCFNLLQFPSAKIISADEYSANLPNVLIHHILRKTMVAD